MAQGSAERRWAGCGALLLLLASGAAGGPCESKEHAVEVEGADCVTCHLSDYEAALDPVHVDSLPLHCAGCHDEDVWRPARFEHDWPLEGAHGRVTCASCHPGNPPDYDATLSDCIGCHADDRARATRPDHSDFSMDCAQCHTTDAWQPADFDHQWPLEGAHAATMCSSCHPGDPPRYSGTPTVCVDCHRADYDASPYPGHADFPTTCEGCHTTNGWIPASGGLHPDNAFPINSGPHKELECMECHNTALGPNGKGNADCVGCHTGEHTRSRLDPKHDEVSNYPSGSAPPNFCLDCHADGRNED